MRHCQVKQPLDGAHACDELAGDLFCCKIAFITLELALVTFEWAYVATPSTAVLALVALEWAFTAVGMSRFESLTFKK